jgi:hypothetical protein
MTFFFSNFFFNPRGISAGAFSGVENSKMWGSSPEMPKTGSPLAKDELAPKCPLVSALRPSTRKIRFPFLGPKKSWDTKVENKSRIKIF